MASVLQRPEVAPHDLATKLTVADVLWLWLLAMRHRHDHHYTPEYSACPNPFATCPEP